MYAPRPRYGYVNLQRSPTGRYCRCAPSRLSRSQAQLPPAKVYASHQGFRKSYTAMRALYLSYATGCGPLCRPNLARCPDVDGDGTRLGWRVGLTPMLLANTREWVGERGPALGAGISGAIVASYHTCVHSVPHR